MIDCDPDDEGEDEGHVSQAAAAHAAATVGGHEALGVPGRLVVLPVICLATAF